MYLATQFALSEEGRAALGRSGADAVMAAVSHYTRTLGARGGESAVGTIASW